uniref:4Fe-4S ferredoxin-type domain-containing protein n=1 Tax=Aegilops tauschii subsp. strangulata TaxID=200361 RepID=A0A453BII0_AEGTS
VGRVLRGSGRNDIAGRHGRFPAKVKSITPERFRWRIHFEFDKCIACEVCVRVCPIDLPVVDWRFEKDIKRKQLLNYSI